MVQPAAERSSGAPSISLAQKVAARQREVAQLRAPAPGAWPPTAGGSPAAGGIAPPKLPNHHPLWACAACGLDDNWQEHGLAAGVGLSEGR